jgi:hypothetical protein
MLQRLRKFCELADESDPLLTCALALISGVMLTNEAGNLFDFCDVVVTSLQVCKEPSCWRKLRRLVLQCVYRCRLMLYQKHILFSQYNMAASP